MGCTVHGRCARLHTAGTALRGLPPPSYFSIVSSALLVAGVVSGLGVSLDGAIFPEQSSGGGALHVLLHVANRLRLGWHLGPHSLAPPAVPVLVQGEPLPPSCGSSRVLQWALHLWPPLVLGAFLSSALLPVGRSWECFSSFLPSMSLSCLPPCPWALCLFSVSTVIPC